jgi:hypothetical protein
MAYQPDCFYVTLLCPVCIVFCMPLSLSVLLPFILSAPYPFNATFLYCAFLLLRSSSLLTLESSYTATPSLFFLLHSYSRCCLCACNLRNASACLVRAKLLHNLSPLSDHHRDSSASLVIFNRSTSLYVVLRFLSLSSSLRLFVFSVTVELTFSISVTGLNAHLAINRLHKHLHPS